MSAGLAYAVFDRPFARPFHYGSRSLASRQGVLLRKRSGEAELYSEASPLPGHSAESLADVLQALLARPASELIELSASGHGKLPPSLRFALEGFVAQESPGAHRVRSNALVRWRNAKETAAELGQLRRAGYDVFKFKIGPRAWAPLFDLLEENPGIRIRLDANQSLSPHLLEKLVLAIGERDLFARVDYLEEPFPKIWDSAAFRDCPLPLAADESAGSPATATKLLSAANPPSVFIVKPTVAGGLFSLEGYFEALAAARKRVVFTSTLEGEAGRRSLLAYLSRAARETSGISTGGLFVANFLGDRPEWTSVPSPSAAEKKYYQSLAWRDCR